MLVPDILHKEERDVLRSGTATRSCANIPTEKVTYLGPSRDHRPPSLQEAFFPCPKMGQAKPRAVSQWEAAVSQTSMLNELARVRTEY